MIFVKIKAKDNKSFLACMHLYIQIKIIVSIVPQGFHRRAFNEFYIDIK